MFDLIRLYTVYTLIYNIRVEIRAIVHWLVQLALNLKYNMLKISNDLISNATCLVKDSTCSRFKTQFVVYYLVQSIYPSNQDTT